MPPLPSRFRLNGRVVDTSANRLISDAGSVQLEPKIMQVLVVLAEHAGEVVTREDIMARVWPDVFVTDDVLNRAIRELRRALGAPDAVSPKPDAEADVIETIRKRGYRLLLTPQAEDAGRSAVLPRGRADWTPGPVALAATIAIAMAAGAALVWLGAGRTAIPTEARRRFVPLTSMPGNEVDPALSPDGTLAFVMRAADGRPHVFLKQAGEAAPRQATFGDAHDLAPAWSNDGRRLAFARATPGDCAVWILDSVSGAERKLASCGARESLRMSWSPDGRSIAAASGGGTVASPFHVELVSAADGSRRKLTTPPPGDVGDETPAFSPDGRHVAFVRSISGSIGDIFVVASDGGEPRRVTSDNADVLGLDWEPDGRHIVFSSDRGGGISLWRVAADGGEPSLVAGGGAKIKHPSVAKRSGAIAYEDWHYEINLVSQPSRAGTSDARHISPTTDQWNVLPQLSPDGTRVAFESTRSGPYELWVAAADGSSPRKITDSGLYKSMPRWSPDGRRLAFVTRSLEGAELHIVAVDGGFDRTVFSDGTTIVAPAWSHDGQRLYFGSLRNGRWQVWSVSASGGDPSPVDAEGAYAAAESPDGRSFYYVRLDRPGLWTRPIDGRGESLATDAIQAEDWANVCFTSAGIYFVAHPDDGDPVLEVVENAGARPRFLTRLPEFAWNGITVSADGQRVLYAHTDRRDANITAIVPVH